MPSQDVWKFTPVSYRTSALLGCCPALTPLLQLIIPSRASGTADHVRSLDDLFHLGVFLDANVNGSAHAGNLMNVCAGRLAFLYRQSFFFRQKEPTRLYARRSYNLISTTVD